VGQVRVDFVPQGLEFEGESYIDLSTRAQLVYYPEYRVVEALDGVRIYHRGLTIEAAAAQIDLEAGVVRARQRSGAEPVTIAKGTRAIRASQLYYTLSDMEGQLVTSVDGKVERLTLHGRDLSTGPAGEAGDLKLFDFVSVAEGSVAVMARGMTVKPGEEIHLRGVRVYMGDRKVLSLPLHVIPLRPGGSARQPIAFTNSGIRLDIPLYYSLTPNSTGALRLRHQRQTGWGYYGSQAGWSLDLVQDYASGASSRGSFGIDRIVGGEGGAHWNHEQQLGQDTRMFAYFDFPAHRDLFGSVNLTHSSESSTLGMSLYGSRLKSGGAGYYGDLYAQSRPKPLLNGYANYSISARTTYAGPAGLNTSPVGFGLQAQLLGRSLALTPSTNLMTSYTIGRDWGGRSAGTTIFATASLFQRIGQTSNLGLVYNYVRDPGIVSTLGHHNLTATGYFGGSSPWQLSFYSTVGLDSPLISGFSEASYQIHPSLRLGVISTYQKFGAANYKDVEVLVGKKVSGQEFQLIYSLDRKAFRLQLAGLNF